MSTKARLKKAGNKTKLSKKKSKKKSKKSKRYVAKIKHFTVKIAKKSIKVETVIVYDVCVFDDDCFKVLKSAKDRKLAAEMLDAQIIEFFKCKELIDLI